MTANGRGAVKKLTVLPHLVSKMHNGNFGYKGFVVCMVLFCGYMQWFARCRF